ncbi:sigma-54-dependent transcriptional regulator [Clostridium aminobutyricum]|uniref:Stage 0 sporulation protein A homolog n=1 Tax=Clostridium aminobutyricum TaxID=33953 RepID=A0A939IH33_CLOAM|nr:sigma-54 dependent transcriptional regulator [Clostridium aminobutyricum]MBN7773037.1 sigma-54-dependent Fis family transcriptional regulator [Clostridium aminobutyricum]
MDFNILIVDDEQDYCEVLKMIFTSKGYHVDTCIDGFAALKMLEEKQFDLVVTDLIMPEMDGNELLAKIKEKYPNVNVIVSTAYGTVEKAVESMKNGAYTCVTKGDSPESLLIEIEGLYAETLERAEEKQKNGKPVHEADDILGEFMLITRNPAYAKTLAMAEKAAKSNANILILGESGSGKDVLTRYIHSKSNRRNNVFMDLNCHAIAENVLESELFGHEKGSFTGAAAKRVGRFEAADHGTLFLDEIGDISLTMQAKLLKVLENKTICRMGSNEETKVDFRLITATNKNLEEEIASGRFREDLFYRLSTIIITVPPLRERKEDLPLLIDYFVSMIGREMEVEKLAISSDVMASLLEYNYPGNIRELKNKIERLVVFAEDGVIRAEGEKLQVKPEDYITLPHSNLTSEPKLDRTLKELRKELESKYIKSVLDECRHDMNRASEILGITRRQLLNKITEYGLR